MDTQTHNPIDQDLALEIVALSNKCAAYIAGGTLDRNGKSLAVSLSKPKTKRRRRRPTRGHNDAAMARRSILGLYENIIASGLSSDAHITGRAPPHFRLSRAQLKEGEWGEPDIEFSEQRGDVLIRRTVLSVPVRRHQKIVSKDGKTTFHLRIYSVSKTHADGSPSATLKRAGSHSFYITRESALASDVSASESINKGDAYVTRSGVVPVSIGERQMLCTNISADAREREEFWEAVVAHERTPGPDTMHVDLDRCRSLLSRIASAPDCPKIFIAELAKIKSKSGTCKLKTGNNDVIKTILERMGEPVPPEVATKDGKRLTDRQRLKDHGFAFSIPRGGRVQMRMEAELPAELSLDQMELVLKGMCNILDRKGLPYIGVIHRPDHNNHEKNWHIHILFYDRPVERFTEAASTLLLSLPSDASEAELERHAKLRTHAAEVTANRSKKQGWDFEIEEHYRSDCGHKRVRYPFEQPKDRTVNNKAFINSMRKAFSDLCNEQLELSKSGRRFHPGSFADLGIPKRPDVKLSSSAQRLEKFGVPTRQGVENERNQFAYRLATFMKQRKASFDALQSQIKGWGQGVRRNLSPEGIARFTATQKQYEDLERRLADKVLVAATYADALNRCDSRATQTIENADKAIAAIDKKPSDARPREKALLLARRQQASDHLVATEALFKPEFERYIELEAEIDLDRFLARELRQKLDQAEAIESALDKLVTNAREALKRTPQAAAKIAAEMAKTDVRSLPALTELQRAQDAVLTIVNAAEKQRMQQSPKPSIISAHRDDTTPAYSRLVNDDTPASSATSREGNSSTVADRGGASNGHAHSPIPDGNTTSQERVVPPARKVGVPERIAEMGEPVANVESMRGSSSQYPPITSPTASRAEGGSSSISRSSQDTSLEPTEPAGGIGREAGQPRQFRMHPSMIKSSEPRGAPKSGEAATGSQTGSRASEHPHAPKSAEDADRSEPLGRSSAQGGVDAHSPPSDAKQRGRRDLERELANLGERLNRARAQRDPSDAQPDLVGRSARAIGREQEHPAADPSPPPNAVDTTASTKVNLEVAPPSSPDDGAAIAQSVPDEPRRTARDRPTTVHNAVKKDVVERRPAEPNLAAWWASTLPKLNPLFESTPALERLADAIAKKEQDLMIMFAAILREDEEALRSIHAVEPRVVAMVEDFAKRATSIGGPARKEPEILAKETSEPSPHSVQNTTAPHRSSGAFGNAPTMAQAPKWKFTGIGLFDEWYTATKDGKPSRAQYLAFEIFDRKFDREVSKLDEVWRQLIVQDRRRYLGRKKTKGCEQAGVEPQSQDQQVLPTGDRPSRVESHAAHPGKPPLTLGDGEGKDPAGAEFATGRG